MDDLVNVFKEWPSHKLLEEYAKANDYEQIAVDAMKAVMLEKGMADDVKRLDAESMLEKENRIKRKEEQELINKFAFAGNEKEFVRLSKNKSGVYFEKMLKTGKQLVRFTTFKWVVFIASFKTIVIGLYISEKDMGIPMLIVLILHVFLVMNYFSVRSKRTKIVLCEENNLDIIRLFRNNKMMKEIKAPFSYSYFYLQDLEKNLFKDELMTVLILIIDDELDGNPIELIEYSPKSNTLTDDWEMKTGGLKKFDSKRVNEWLGKKGDLKVEIEKLVRILNGLNPEKKLN